MSQLISDASILVHSLGWAIFHSLWQGALVFTCMKLVFICTPNAGSAGKYRLSFLALCLLFTWFSLDFLQEWERLQAITVTITETGAQHDYKVYLVKTIPQAAGLGSFESKARVVMEHYFPVLVLAYMLGLIFLTLRFGLNLYQIHSSYKKDTASPEPSLLDRLDSLKQDTGIERKIKLLLTHHLKVPIVFGAIRPVILLPFAMVNQLSTEQLDAILIHELAHIKRNDYLLNIFQTLIETLLFFNPFSWLISSAIRREREHCCDDLVLAHTSMPLPYAKALAALESYRLDPGSPALAATGTSNQLFNRIKRIMEMKKDRINYGQIIIPVLIVAAIAASLIWLTPSFAQARGEKHEKDKKTESTSSSKITIIDDNGNKKEYHSIHELPAETKRQIRKAIAESGVAVESADEALKIADDVLNHVDVEGITDNVNQALKEIDWKKINKEVAMAMKDVDREKLHKDIDKALKEVDWDKINAEVSAALDEANKALKDPALREDVKAQIREARAQARQELEDARQEIEELKQERADDRHKNKKGRGNWDDEDDLPVPAAPVAPAAPAWGSPGTPVPAPSSPEPPTTSKYERMLKEMEADHLIDLAKGFEIRKKGSTLTIDGKEQYDYVKNKYEKYMKGDDVSIKGKIKGNNRSLSISISN